MGESASAEIQKIAYHRASLVDDITREIESLEPRSSPKFCIYKIPDSLRKLKEEAYTPQIVSIGPLHNGNEKLQNMEKYKVRYLKEFMERAKINLENLAPFIEELEESVRQCYAETIPLSRYDFVKMIIMDASFIIELLVRNWLKLDEIVLEPLSAARMRLDLMLLENQLPFFIIEKLFDLAFPSRRHLASLTKLAFHYFSFQRLSPNPELRIMQIESSSNLGPKIMHFVDLLRKVYLPQSLPTRAPKIVDYMYGANQLKEVGLKFEVNRSGNCLLDIALDYKKGVLKVPHFILDNATELYARNLIAFEQCHYPMEAYVTDYFLLLHFLIKSEKDVELLSRKGIVVNGLGDNDATFINNLGTVGIVYYTMSSNYFNLCKRLQEFYDDPSHSWLASLRRDYFGTPWKATSTIAAIILLILTFIQAVCSIISVIHPQHH